jgi:threonine dehydratase
VFLNTPQFVHERLSADLEREVLVKVETINPIGSFKGRGTWLLADHLDPAATWVCATAGNFGQGLAYAARPRSARVDVFVSPEAPASKVQRMRSLGAHVEVVPEPESAADTHALAGSDRTLVLDGLHPAIAEGAGTIGVELDAHGPIDTAVIQLGDGALISGVARWLKARNPATHVIGVCATGAPAMARSFAARRPVSVQGEGTIAAALGVTRPIPESVDRVVALVDDVVLVDDGDLRRAMELVAETMGVLVEPAGAAGLAALSRHRARIPGNRIAILLTGAA